MPLSPQPSTLITRDAQHAFANPTSARYDAGNVALAWRPTTEFLKRQLRG